MVIKHINKIFIKTLIIFSLTFILFVSQSNITLASSKGKNTTSIKNKSGKSKKSKKGRRHPRRHYYPEKTRAEAEEIIRSNPYISGLAGLDSQGQETTFEGLPVDSVLKMERENIAELEKEDDVVPNLDDMDFFRNLALVYSSDDDMNEMTEGGIRKQEIMNTVMEWLGTPYHFGGSTDHGIDCSAFVQTIFHNCAGLYLPRTARDQYTFGDRIGMDKLEFGDLVFFHTYSRRFASHVGIYLKDNLFVHSSSRFGVTVSSLESTYYNKHFIGGKRLRPMDISRLGAENWSKNNDDN
jgi:hypothetical protein